MLRYPNLEADELDDLLNICHRLQVNNSLHLDALLNVEFQNVFTPRVIHGSIVKNATVADSPLPIHR